MAADNADTADTALREELRLVEEELAELRRTAAEIRRRIGDRADAPTDPAEVGATIELAEEQEALTAVLEDRREKLLERLGKG
jgi:F0F1-type ATP synthase membrane subunit b/b'